jgi:hypothetical protein
MPEDGAGEDGPADREPIEAIARSFYERLRAEGFTSDQIVHLANDMLSLVREDLASTVPPARPRDEG